MAVTESVDLHMGLKEGEEQAIDESWQRQLEIFAAWDKENDLIRSVPYTFDESTSHRTRNLPGMEFKI